MESELLSKTANGQPFRHVFKVEFELTGLFLGQVGQIECNTYYVTLYEIVVIVRIVIDDVHVAILDTWPHILKVIKRIGKYIVAVAACDGADG